MNISMFIRMDIISIMIILRRLMRSIAMYIRMRPLNTSMIIFPMRIIGICIKK